MEPQIKKQDDPRSPADSHDHAQPIEGVIVPLSVEHADWLTTSAIDLDVAIAAGVHTIVPGTWGPEWTDDPRRSPIPILVADRPALVFPWRDPWSDGTAYQVTVYPRDEEWSSRDSKYLFEKGSGGRAFLHPAEETKMRRLIKEGADVRRLAIVEGTKQGLSGASNSDDNTVVITMAGCWGWRAKVFADGADEDPTGSTPAAWLSGIIALLQPTEVVLFIDADVATNPKVHAAAKGLSEAVEFLTSLNGEPVAPRFATLPGAGGTTGLDDFLSTLPSEKRAAGFEVLIANAGPLPKAPTKAAVAAANAAKTASLDSLGVTLHVDEERNVIVDGQPLTDWSARIVTTKTFSNPLDPMVKEAITHDLHVTFPDGNVHQVADLPDESLTDVRSWLGPLGGGRGTGLYVHPNRSTAEWIAQALRSHLRSERTYRAGFLVTGNHAHPVTGAPGFVTPTGFIGATSSDPAVTAKVTGRGALIDIPDPHALTSVQIREGVKAMLDARDAFNDDLPYLAVLSFQIAVLAGMQPVSAPMLVARGGAGKSVLLGLCQSMIGPFHSKNLPSFVNTSQGVLNRMAWGLHQIPWVVDDYIPAPADKPDGGDAEAGLRTLARRSYDAESASREVLEPDGRNGFKQAVTDKAVPGFIFGGEAALAQRQINATTLDRMLAIEMIHPGDATDQRPATIKSSGSAKRIEEITRSRLLGRVAGDFIRWCQQQRAKDPTWATRWDKDVRALLTENTLAEAGTDPRHREVLSTSALGAMLLALYLVESKHLTETEAEALQDHICRGLIDLMNRHVDRFAYSQRSAADKALAVIQQIRSKVAAQQVDLPGVSVFAENDRRPQIKVGAVSKGKDGILRVALDRDTTASVLNVPSDVLVSALRPVAVPTAAGKTVRAMNLNGVSGVQAIVIDPAVWPTTVAGDDEEVAA